MVGRAGRTRTRSADVPARSGTSAVAMTVSEVFHRITSALGEAGIPYMLAGSFASAYYGAPRTTQDIDLGRSERPEPHPGSQMPDGLIGSGN